MLFVWAQSRLLDIPLVEISPGKSIYIYINP